MKVSELAERAGIAPSAVRWYESVGIIPPARQPNGYREYAEEDLARLRLVVSLRRLGLGPGGRRPDGAAVPRTRRGRP